MNVIVMIAFLMALSLPGISHAHPNHAGEIGHDHRDFVAGLLAFATPILVFTVAAALRWRPRKRRQHVVVESGLYRCPSQ